jgi:hypothetical protein
LLKTVMPGFWAAAPASKPAWNACSSGTLTPPMKPTLPVLVAAAARTPTR